ncbi:hypothetical protein GmRootV213_08510 [Variovorax sp. V213]|uniref:hypothetical protein n=1 Tax=Variovorax sp. V213 TaxID=3065955 RepID=UPI0034E8AD30
MTQARKPQAIGRRGLLAAVGAAGLSAVAPPIDAAQRVLPLTAQATQGRYSGFGGQGEDRALSFEGNTFLRGSQQADREGTVAFATVYTGWDAARTRAIVPQRA